MSIYLLRDATTVEQVASLASTLGLSCSRDEPWTSGVVYVSWAGDAGCVTLANDGRSGAQLLLVEEEEDDAITLAVREVLTLDSAEDVLEEAQSAAAPGDKIRLLHRAHALRLVPGLQDDKLVALQCERLHDDDELVRWAAARLLLPRAERRVEQAFAEALQSHSDLAGAHARVRAQCEAQDQGTLYDTPTEAWHELLQRGREGLRHKHFRRIERAMDALLEDCSDHTEALWLRAQAYVAQGETTLAKALLGAAETSARIERDGLEGKELVALEQLLVSIVSARDALPETPDAHDDAALLVWLERWARDGRDPAACGAALAVLNEAPNFAGVLAFVAGRHRHDRRLLERAVALAPRSPWAHRALAAALKTDGPDQAATLYERALELLNTEEQSDAERAIDRLGALFETALLSSTTTLEAGLLDDLAGLYYDERRWEDAIRHADRLVVADPSSTTAWQWRANARTFLRRHEEAVQAYRDALSAIDVAYRQDSAVVGSDPRPGMHFSLACVLCALDDRDAALDSLRRAVRGEAKWAAEAQSDDYFEPLWPDARFERIVALEPQALVFDAERDPELIDALVKRALGLCHRGNFAGAAELAERATMLAELCDLPELVVRALGVHARALAFGGDADLGVAKAVKARALAEADEVTEHVRTDLAHELGVVLHAAGNHERAADAYQRALSLRKELYGDAHPTVAKSLSDMARLAADRGEPTASLYREGVELLERFLANDDDAPLRDEAEVDLAILQSSLAESLEKDGATDEALAAMQRCVDAIEAVLARDIPLAQPFVDHVLEASEGLVRATVASQRSAARSLVARLEACLCQGTPEQRQERSFWLRLRRFARGRVRAGVPEKAVAHTLAEALRGGRHLPRELERIPEVAGFAKALADRATRYPTLLAMAVMALSTAEATGNLDEALENLQELCVAALVDGTLKR